MANPRRELAWVEDRRQEGYKFVMRSAGTQWTVEMYGTTGDPRPLIFAASDAVFECAIRRIRRAWRSD